MSNFKKQAAQHQLHFFPNENQYNLPQKGRAQDHWLNDNAAKEGRIFYADYFIFKAAKKDRIHKTNTPEWFYDTLRSQHIPFNFFVPLQTEQELCIKTLNKLFDLQIIEVKKILFEHPPHKQNPLKDKTSFDVFVECSEKSRKLFLGIEIKYTEGAYSLSETEKNRIADTNSTYYKNTSSLLYKDTTKLKENSYRQIWRNHILGAAYQQQNGYQHFIAVTIYPEGNKHFAKAMADFEVFLTDEGKKTFKGLTYEHFFQTLAEFATTDKQRNWIKYLNDRYLINKNNNH